MDQSPVGLTMQSGMKSRGNGQNNIQSFIDKNNRILEDCWVVICGQWQLAGERGNRDV
jgi:hypothetical protein